MAFAKTTGNTSRLCLEMLEERLALSASPSDLGQEYQAWRHQTFSLAQFQPEPDHVSANPLLEQSRNLVGVNKANSTYPSYTGKGYTVAIIDSGIDYNHKALGGGWGKRVVAGYDFVDDDTNPMDEHGHGTNVAGIVGSSDPTHLGAAPGVNFVALRVLDSTGNGNFGRVEDALDWVIANQQKYNIVSINLSLGEGNYTSNPYTFLDDEFEELNRKGVFIATAAGNNYFKENSKQGLSFPSISPYTVSVGAVWDGNHGSATFGSGAKDNTTAADRVASFSQRSSALDLLAPGAYVVTTGRNNTFASTAGTSMASPFVAGAAVLVHQALNATGQGQLANQRYILSLLKRSGVNVKDGDDENDNVTNTNLTFKRIAIDKALDLAVKPATLLYADDVDGNYNATGSWERNNSSGVNSTHRINRNANGDTATWTFNNLKPGVYRASVTWKANSAAATNASFSVLDNATTVRTVALNQRNAPNDVNDNGATWEFLGGNFNVTSTKVVIRLTDNAGGIVIADAVRLERVGDSPAGPEVQVADSGNKVSESGITTVDFGQTLVNKSLERTFTVQNTGNQTLQLVNNIKVPAGYTLTAGFGKTSLAPGQSTTFRIRLDAKTHGTFAGDVTFGTNDSNESTFRFRVTGVVTRFTQYVDDGDSAFSTTGSWKTTNNQGFRGDFRTAKNGQSADTATWTFNNLSSGTYKIWATWKEGSDRASNAPYTIFDGNIDLGTVQRNQKVAPNDLTDLNTKWEELATVQVVNGKLVVRLSDGANGVVSADSIRIERIGDVSNGPEVRAMNSVSALSEIARGTVDFGQTVASKTVEKTITIKNIGNNTLKLSNPIKVPNGYTVTAGFGKTSLTPGQSTNFRIRLDAKSKGTYNGEVSFGTNDSNESIFRFNLKATVSNATQIVDDGDSAFMRKGSWSTTSGQGFRGDYQSAKGGNGANVSTWTFRNLKSGTYKIYGTWKSGADRATDAPYTIRDSGNFLTTVRRNQKNAPNDFTDENTPWEWVETVQVLDGTLTVELSDQANGRVIADGIRIERVGDLPSTPALRISDGQTVLPPGSGLLDFNSTTKGKSVTKTVRIRNISNQNITLKNPTLPTGYSLVESIAKTLGSGASVYLKIRLNATSTGTFQGNVDIFTTTNNKFTFKIKGVVNVAAGAAKAASASSETLENLGLGLDDGVRSVVAGQELDFGETSLHQPLAKVLTVRNETNTEFSLSEPTLPPGFSLLHSLAGKLLPPGKTRAFTIRLDATSVGSYAGEVRVKSSHGKEFPFVLRGDVVGPDTRRVLAGEHPSENHDFGLLLDSLESDQNERILFTLGGLALSPLEIDAQQWDAVRSSETRAEIACPTCSGAEDEQPLTVAVPLDREETIIFPRGDIQGGGSGSPWNETLLRQYGGQVLATMPASPPPRPIY